MVTYARRMVTYARRMVTYARRMRIVAMTCCAASYRGMVSNQQTLVGAASNW